MNTNKEIKQQILTGERALFQGKALQITDCVFMDGKSISPLSRLSKTSVVSPLEI